MLPIILSRNPKQFYSQFSVYKMFFILFLWKKKSGCSLYFWCYAFHYLYFGAGFPDGSDSKESACNVGDLGLIPGLVRSPEEGKGYPFQYSGLVNYMEGIVHWVAKSRTWLSGLHFHFYFQGLTGSVNSVMPSVDLWTEIFYPVFASMLLI